MSKRNKVRQHAIASSLEKHLHNIDSLLDALGADTLHNAHQKIEGKNNKIAQLEEDLRQFIEISGTTNKGRAKDTFKNLMRQQAENLDLSSLPEIFHKPSPIWILGRNVPKEDGGFLRLSPSKAEKHHRTMLHRIIEAWSLTYTRDAGLGEALREEMVEKYRTLAPEKFDTICYSYINEIDDEGVHQSTEVTVPLVEALHYCVGLYPDQLLEDCRAEGDHAGEVSEAWFKTVDTKYTAAQTAEDKEELARSILTRYIFRLRGGKGLPTPVVENEIKRLLSTERWQPYGPEWVVNEHTRLNDLVETLTYTTA
jgi:hypothetical protein